MLYLWCCGSADLTDPVVTHVVASKCDDKDKMEQWEETVRRINIQQAQCHGMVFDNTQFKSTAEGSDILLLLLLLWPLFKQGAPLRTNSLLQGQPDYSTCKTIKAHESYSIHQHIIQHTGQGHQHKVQHQIKEKTCIHTVLGQSEDIKFHLKGFACLILQASAECPACVEQSIVRARLPILVVT